MSIAIVGTLAIVEDASASLAQLRHELQERSFEKDFTVAVVVVVIVCIAIMALFFAVTIAGGRAHDRQNLEAEMQRLADGHAATKAKVPPVVKDNP